MSDMSWDKKSLSVEIRRRKDAVFNFGVAEDIVILSRKNSGEHCICYVVERQEAVYRCKLCYGVGYLGGYDIIRFDLHKNQLKARIGDVTRVIEVEDLGEKVISEVSFSLIEYPRITTKDILVRLYNGRRYSIESVVTDLLGGLVVGIRGSMKELDAGHVIYKLAIV